MDEEAVKRERKRERNMPKHDDNSNTQQVTLCRHVASRQFFFLLSKNNLEIFLHPNAHFISSLALPFLLSPFQILIRGLGWSGSWQRSHLVSLLPARAAGGV